MRESSLPFERQGGQDSQTALFNRISALKRIEFLSGVNLANETPEFKKLIDIELYTRWYKDYPADHAIDEEWCQRATEVVKELKARVPKELSVLEEGSTERVKELFTSSKLKPYIPTEMNKVAEPENISLFRKIICSLKKPFLKQ